ncbi:MAG TPA: acyl-ACP desaturase [Candidatus Binataceae bacterium]|jgi:acyl-[acyl-carrier-protein] desaturase
MGAVPTMREKVYRSAMEFFEIAEQKRNWNLFGDIPWDKLDSSLNSHKKAICIETFCAEELYLPDYSSRGMEIVRSSFGMAWFHARWSLEESKHGLVFREYLVRSGMRSEAEFEALEKLVFSKTWQPPFGTPRRMYCYAALQEGATYLAYKTQKDKADLAGDSVLSAIFNFVGRDEAAHWGFYRKVIELELAEDRAGTLADLALVISQFKMPADGLIPNYQQRLKSSGAGISSRNFVEHVLLPTLKTIGTDRAELRSARVIPAASEAPLAKLAS